MNVETSMLSYFIFYIVVVFGRSEQKLAPFLKGAEFFPETGRFSRRFFLDSSTDLSYIINKYNCGFLPIFR